MILAQGAEARLIKLGNQVVKERFSKQYRLPIIDAKLRKSRTKREAKILNMCKAANIPAPDVLSVCDKSMKLNISFINGKKLRDVLTPELAREMGILVGKLHSLDIVHADLTTSNILVKDKLHIIDFGLSYISLKVEDKAVDLHVLDRALQSSHHNIYNECINKVFEGYKESYPDSEKVFKRLKTVQNRGRNKHKSSI